MADAVKGKKKTMKLGQNPHGLPKTYREILAKKKKAIQFGDASGAEITQFPFI